MKRQAWLLFPALLLLGSCAATYTYTHPTKSASQLERDWAECERIARTKLAAKGVTCARIIGEEAGRCLEKNKGWRRKD